MRLEILQVPGCPNVALLEQRLENVLADQQSEVRISHRVIDDPAAAADAGMTGSPTLLVDGADPFATPGLVPSVSCRLYPSEGGGVGGAPSVAALRQALHTAAADTAAEPADDGGDCCSVGIAAESPLVGLGGWRGAARPQTPAERTVHHAILRAFADRGVPPEEAELDSVAAEFGEPGRLVLDRLHTADVIRLDPVGRIASAYPFSPSPTPHRVRIGGGADVYAMCAVDALGMSAMLGTEVVIESADPVTGEPITVTVRGESAVANPATVVVFVGAEAGHGPSADTCCTSLNFFTARATAQSWAHEHPQVGGIVVDLADSTRLGATIFGGALTT
ncbi:MULTISPECIES: alkylmercury lyase family protein [unclassified Rhodococcus (in: high G+C Gram-positive bacteria)]|uniref:alkylmercury lyase family protein n=1 Tax=unclassified Rhodococcus (in: high G+C Gram-positive bacteria) TaxID=192944 RepID=UPI00163A6E2C|nr:MULTISPECIES: alkylmercury lyase family protein [unclassified Rhodococcus (in: high G+C Gram-positive bacteria)]MBC2644920.1 alkylmercury lyase family protein [Rhodococcus sp. 3A]MBC2890922.1 alkylmercury lyase family protein [Rhodococcus sp. 4CII]